MAFRWVLEGSPRFAALAISASCLLCLAPLFAFWPLNKISRDQIPIFLAGSFWMLINFLYMGMQFPSLPFAASDDLKLQPIRSAAMALAAIVMTILLIQRIRATNRQRALFAGELQAAATSSSSSSLPISTLPPGSISRQHFFPRAKSAAISTAAACFPTVLSGSFSGTSAVKAPPPR